MIRFHLPPACCKNTKNRAERVKQINGFIHRRAPHQNRHHTGPIIEILPRPNKGGCSSGATTALISIGETSAR